MVALRPDLAAGVSGAAPPRPRVLWALGAAGVAASGASIWLALTSEDLSRPGLQVTLTSWITLGYVSSGLIAWRRRPDSRFGPLMVTAGFGFFFSTLQWADGAFLHTVGHLLDLLPAALWLHVFLAFPTGRLARRKERVGVLAAYLAAVGLQVVKMVARPDVAEIIENVQLIALSAGALAGAADLVLRARAKGRAHRRPAALLIGSFALALVMIALLLLAGAFQWPVFETLRRLTFVVIGLAPVAFLAGLLDARLARSGVGDLLVELREDPTLNLREGLARALRDPSLTLAYWLPQYGTWADEQGRPVRLPGAAEGRTATLVDRAGAHVAALVHDASLEDEQELLDAVSAVTGIALENGRLQAELRARLQELQGSRLRVIEAGQRERQRLERNLHDGAQQRLVALSLELGVLADRLAADPEARTQVERVRREIATSLEELRDVARGIHPAVLTGHGLAVALESLAAKAPVPLRLEVELDGRPPEPVEVAAYYVACECLANIGRHAQARSAVIEVTLAQGSLVVEVVDDGMGGADVERGSGLRGLADRVEALGGRLRVWSPRDGGTRVRAELPCE